MIKRNKKKNKSLVDKSICPKGIPGPKIDFNDKSFATNGQVKRSIRDLKTSLRKLEKEVITTNEDVEHYYDRFLEKSLEVDKYINDLQDRFCNYDELIDIENNNNTITRKLLDWAILLGSAYGFALLFFHIYFIMFISITGNRPF